jgi:ribulose 1,5-bisphosphate synthetase/thiazole synthase
MTRTAALVVCLATALAASVHGLACDIVVAGGSTASLAAAITAAEAAPELTVCFTEITDWPGGQMSSGTSQCGRECVRECVCV